MKVSKTRLQHLLTVSAQGRKGNSNWNSKKAQEVLKNKHCHITRKLVFITVELKSQF